MERITKVEALQNIGKEADVHELLFDLLPKMGYDDVTLTHERGSLPENGKDIVASKFDNEENKKEWYAFVVKKGDVRGTSQGVQEIRAQVIDCFDYSWNSIVKGKNIKINKVKVVINGKYTGGALMKILDDNSLGNPNISFWSSNELVEYIDRFYPRYWLKGSKAYKHYVEVFLEKNKEDDITKSIGIKNTKVKNLIDLVIKPRLLELVINDEGDFRRKAFELENVSRIEESSLIVGESGSGKSTFFKQLAADIIHENSLRNDYEYYPFILKFSDFASCDFDVEKVLTKYLMSADFKGVEIDIESILEKKNYVLFIDALDELGTLENKENSLLAIQQFRLANPNIKIYCSSRPGDSLLASCQKLNFRYLEISNVTSQQAEQYISKYFSGEQVKCKRLLKSLRDSQILDKLPKTPLTLALIAAIFDESEIEIPATISDLYKNFVDLLLNKSLQDSTLDLLKIGIHRSVLAYFAEYMHINRRKQMPRKELRSLLNDFAKERGQNYDIDNLLSDLIDNIGLLLENDRGEIEFKHFSFQEYFTAYQLYNHNINGKSNFVNNFNDIWWQNVAIFFAGMTKDSPELIDEILTNSKPNNFREYLINLSGIGFLLQALYNTPIASRILGVERNLENAAKAADFLLTTTDTEYDVLKIMFNTQYGVYKMMSHWYELHHSSITLKSPLEQEFKRISTLIKDKDTSAENRIKFEYAAYLLASTLSDIDDYNVNFLQELLLIVNPENNFVVSLIDSNFNYHIKKLSKEEKARKDVKKLKQQLDFLDSTKIAESVNIKLIDGKKIIKKPVYKGSRNRKNRRNRKGR